MSDPAPLTDSQVNLLKREAERQIGASVNDTLRLLATVEQMRRERDQLREFFDACEGAQVRPVRCDDDCIPHREQYERWQAARDALLASPAPQGEG